MRGQDALATAGKMAALRYSFRSAAMGLTVAARRAGMKLATRAAKSRDHPNHAGVDARATQKWKVKSRGRGRPRHTGMDGWLG